MSRSLFDISSVNLLETDMQIDKDVCSICLDDLDDEKTLYNVEGCNHIFHTKCILEMYIKGDTKSCPLCRSQISVTNNTNVTTIVTEKFKMDLIKKYVKRKNANSNVVSIYTEYVNFDKKLLENKKELTSVQKEMVNLKKNNKVIFKEKDKLEENLSELKTFMKRNTLGFVSKYRRFRRAACNKTSLKFIKDIIKNVSIEIVTKINNKVEDVETELCSVKENNVFKDYELLEKKRKKIATQRIKIYQQQCILKTAMLNIPIKPVN